MAIRTGLRRPITRLASGCLQVWIAAACCNGLNAQTASDSAFDLSSWIEAVLEKDRHIGTFQRDDSSPWFGRTPPDDVTAEQWAEALVAGLSEFDTTAQQIACLKILVERLPVTSTHYLMDIVSDKTLNVEVREAAIHVAGVMRVPAWIGPLMELLDDPESRVRAAAIDAVGVTISPAYPFDKGDKWILLRGPLRINCKPAIALAVPRRLGRAGGHFDNLTDEFVRNLSEKMTHHAPEIPDDVTRRVAAVIREVMLESNQPDVRAAAARATMGWQTGNANLRFAEWGVWIDANGQLDLVETVLREIPPFVHRTTNQVSELQQRVNEILIVNKPVVHLTVDEPLVVDVKAFIHHGQPWFAFPRPADFALKVGGSVDQAPFSDESLLRAALLVKSVDVSGTLAIGDLRDGFPWVDPPTTKVGDSGGGMGTANHIQSIGLNWQSLIVSPDKPDWMQLPDVTEEFAWWEKLRQVNSAWIGSGDTAGNEAERFLYYDGPTIVRSPLIIHRSHNRISFEYKDHADKVVTAPALLVQVDESGNIKGRELGDVSSLTIDKSDPEKISWSVQGDEVIDALIRLVCRDNGLNADEANGLVSAWETHFFRSPGTRLLTRITREDYDWMCPLEIRPRPRELARVGLIARELEFGKDPDPSR